jgi:hypothetical protein
VLLINPNVELDKLRLRSRVDAFERIEEGKREEFVEFVSDKAMEAFSSGDAKLENAGLNNVSVKTVNIIMQEIILYFIPAKLNKNCIKKIHRL